MQYSRELGFDETPDYDWLRRLFEDVLIQLDDNDGIFDWQLLNDGKGWQSIAKEKRQARTKKLLGPPPPPPAQVQAPVQTQARNETTKANQTLQEQTKHHNLSSDNKIKKNTSRKLWSKFETIFSCGMC